MPVSLPVPFSGALDGNTRLLVANGENVPKNLAITFPAGTVFPLFNSDGSRAGTLLLDLQQGSSRQNCGAKTCFTAPATLFFSDGSFVSADSMQFFDYPYDPEAIAPGLANPTLPPLAPGQALTKGVASGYITQAGGTFASDVGKTMNYRYVHISTPSGTRSSLDQIVLSTWLIYR